MFGSKEASEFAARDDVEFVFYYFNAVECVPVDFHLRGSV